MKHGVRSRKKAEDKSPKYSLDIVRKEIDPRFSKVSFEDLDVNICIVRAFEAECKELSFSGNLIELSEDQLIELINAYKLLSEQNSRIRHSNSELKRENEQIKKELSQTKKDHEKAYMAAKRDAERARLKLDKPGPRSSAGLLNDRKPTTEYRNLRPKKTQR